MTAQHYAAVTLADRDRLADAEGYVFKPANNLDRALLSAPASGRVSASLADLVGRLR